MEREFANGVLKEIEGVLPEIAKLLGIKQQECEMIDIYADLAIDVNFFVKKSCRDRLLKHKPLNSNKSFIRAKHHSDSFPIKIGINLYLTEYNTKYIVYSTITAHEGIASYLFIKTKELYKFKRYTIEKLTKTNRATKPILLQETINDILDNSINFLSQKKILKQYNVAVKRGILLTGAPGNGKTMLSKWIKKLAISKGFSTGEFTGAEIEYTFHQGGNLHGMLNGKEVIFGDDIDIEYFTRKSHKSEIACAMLTGMDGIESGQNVVRIFTTNEELKDIDEAFLRPGRIDKVIEIGKPTAELRRDFILTWHKDILEYFDEHGLVDIIVDKTENFSFSEIESIKTFLVMKYIQTKEWDYYGAFDLATEEMYKKKCEIVKKKKVGFNNNKIGVEKYERTAGISTANGVRHRR